MGRRFFPLDEKLRLMRGAYTPQVQEAITRLGSRLTYKEAQEELKMLWGVDISVGSVRVITMRNGQIANELLEEEKKRLEREAPKAEATPKQIVVSVDGAMVQVKSGEWREVKTVAIGEYEERWDAKNKEVVTQTEKISYFSSVDKAEQFADKALVEWHHRGVENAEKVVAVNDGASWIQAFIDYHCPQATRVIDFAHAKSYVATVGKILYGAESDSFKTWYAKMSKQLGKQSPQRTINDLRFLWKKNIDHPEVDEIDHAIRYLERRQEMIDYAHFRKKGVPIGSGMVESAHKVVMQRRMKQAGMRWAEKSLNPMLALRTSICNQRWTSTWQAIQAHYLAQKHTLASKEPEEPNSIVSEQKVRRLETFAEKLKKRTKKKHPWRNQRWIFPYRTSLLHKN